MNKTDKEINLPDSLLTRLFDCTGTQSQDTKGFLLFYINGNGQPSFTSKTSNAMGDLALHKFLEIFLLSNNENKIK